MYKGSVWLQTPMLYALIFLFVFTIGGVTGIMVGAIGVDIHLHDTYFIVAHFHYTMMGGTVMALLAGVHYWWPKMFGKMYSKRWAVVAWVLTFVGFNMTFMSQFLLGTQGMPRRYYTYLDQYQRLHGFSSIGSYILGLGFIVMFFYLIHSLYRGRVAGSNPWAALSMEWSTSSPPPEHNFLTGPVMTHDPYDYDKVEVSSTLTDSEASDQRSAS